MATGKTIALTAAAAKMLQSCPTLSDPMNFSLSSFSVHGIFQARVLEWVASAFSRPCDLVSLKGLLVIFKKGK